MKIILSTLYQYSISGLTATSLEKLKQKRERAEDMGWSCFRRVHGTVCTFTRILTRFGLFFNSFLNNTLPQILISAAALEPKSEMTADESQTEPFFPGDALCTSPG